MNGNEIKTLEAKIKALESENARAEAALSTKAQLLAHVSHELRTPLGVMLGYADLALDRTQSAEEREACLHTIKRNGEQLLELINELLDLSKAEAGCIDIEERDFSLAELLADLRVSFEMACEEKKISLRIRCEGPVPKFLRSDSQRVRQILTNLVANAVKFTDRGGVDVVVTSVPAGESTRNVSFEVTDTGIGIPEQQRDRLFKAFSQTDAGKNPRYRGTGLGLALSQKLAVALGSELFLRESSPDEGSTFVFKMKGQPWSERDGFLDLDVERVAEREDDADPNLSGVRVLVAEDAPEIRLIVRRYLERAGATVEIAENGVEAIQRAHAEHFDLVLMDLQMPLLNGYDAAEKLRMTGFDRPIIALTAHAMGEDRDRCLRKGFDDHLTKPVDRQNLLMEVKEYASKPGRAWTH